MTFTVDEGGHVGGRAVRDVALESVERRPVEVLHHRGHPLGALRTVAAESAPEGHPVSPGDLPAGVGAVLLDGRDRPGAALGGGPDSQPPVAEVAGATEGGLGPAADDERDRRVGGRPELRALEGEELAGMGDLLAGEEAAQQSERLVHPTPPGPRVHATGRDLGAVVAADAEPETQAPGGELGEREELACHQEGVAQDEQVHREVDVEIARGQDRGGVDQSIVAHAAVEHHVVTDPDVVHPGGRHEPQ
jgi:hypothetical protein